MLRQWVHLLPEHVSNGWMVVALAGMIVGLIFWVSGARFSRLFIGLSAVTLGAIIGISLPKYMGWSISGAGPAVGLALILGVSGLLLQRLWVGLFFSIVVAAWAFLVTWVSCRAPEAMQFDFSSFSAWWQSLPPNVASWLPFTCGIGAAVAVMLALIWPRAAIAAVWSTAGVSLLAGLGTMAMQMSRPQLLQRFPQQLGPQLSVVFAMITIGIAMQWRVAGRVAGPPAHLPRSESYDRSKGDE